MGIDHTIGRYYDLIIMIISNYPNLPVYTFLAYNFLTPKHHKISYLSI